jgi:hypothetical protein
MEHFDIFNCRLEYFTNIRDILWPFGTFFRFWCHAPKKSGNPVLLSFRRPEDNYKTTAECIWLICGLTCFHASAGTGGENRRFELRNTSSVWPEPGS